MTDIAPETVARMLERLKACTKGLRSFYKPGAVELIPAGTMDEAADMLEALSAERDTLSARLAEVEATLKLALPHLEENARWHRDAQSHAQKCEAAFAIVAATRAALQETKK